MAAAAPCFCGKTLELERFIGLALAEVKQVNQLLREAVIFVVAHKRICVQCLNLNYICGLI
jgi:aspartate/tyrosine/aromatic aminotransferase